MKIFFFLLIIFSNEALGKTFIFGSCLHQKKSQVILNAIQEKKADKIIFMGDNVYGDVKDNTKNLKSAYNTAKVNLAQFNKHNILAIWDDHDYGINDGGSDFVHKQESKELFLNFWDIPKKDPRWKRQGIYFDYEEIINDNKIHFVFLDTRFNRSKLKKNKVNLKKKYTHDVNKSKTFLGYEQWTWVENIIKKNADVRFIVSSIQVIPEDHGFEKWSNFPEEKKKLFDLIKNHKNTYFLSGDRHISSIYKEKFKEKEFFEITSSGLNMAWKDNNEKDSKQIIDTINTNNFGLIKFSNRFFDVLFFDENGKKIHSSHFIIKR